MPRFRPRSETRIAIAVAILRQAHSQDQVLLARVLLSYSASLLDQREQVRARAALRRRELAGDKRSRGCFFLTWKKQDLKQTRHGVGGRRTPSRVCFDEVHHISKRTFALYLTREGYLELMWPSG